MRLLAITGFCAIALLSACDGAQVGPGGTAVGEPKRNDITLPCPGKNVDTHDWKVDTSDHTLRFHTDGRCQFTPPGLQFNPPNNSGFSAGVENSSHKTVSYQWDGTPIPATGYPFSYTNDDPRDGNGSGVIK
jgi:hypothetical protein